ncbi:type II toxin-antitoxin system Phd/YefM family antitoxin [Sphingobium cupriresistens]|nr:type II toxin-antitoxin system Phd/YefM family antitoxin [Sphingobium cupriresistens]
MPSTSYANLLAENTPDLAASRYSVIAQKSHFSFIGAMGQRESAAMKTMSAREAKNGFGLMIDTARASPVLIEKHGRGVVVVLAVEEYERLKAKEAGTPAQ